MPNLFHSSRFTSVNAIILVFDTVFGQNLSCWIIIISDRKYWDIIAHFSHNPQTEYTERVISTSCLKQYNWTKRSMCAPNLNQYSISCQLVSTPCQISVRYKQQRFVFLLFIFYARVYLNLKKQIQTIWITIKVS